MLVTKSGTIAGELERRSGLTKAVVELFLRQPGIWIQPPEIAKAGGFSAWRSRVSDARSIVALDGYDIVWNGKNGAGTAYMLRPKALGRDSAEQVPAPWNQDRPFVEDFKLS